MVLDVFFFGGVPSNLWGIPNTWMVFFGHLPTGISWDQNRGDFLVGFSNEILGNKQKGFQQEKWWYNGIYGGDFLGNYNVDIENDLSNWWAMVREKWVVI